MIPKSGNRFSDKTMRKPKKHDPEPKVRGSEKWEPVFGQDHA
jgi:hypothetical protein